MNLAKELSTSMISKIHLLLLTITFTFCTTLTAKPYVTVHLNGQLGNQMHQIAAAIALAEETGADPLFPELAERGDLDIPLNREFFFYRLNSSLLPEAVNHRWQEPKHTYTPIVYKPNIELFGHFQSYKYFDKYREKIVALLSPKPELVEELKNRFPTIAHHPMSVAIHVRTYNKENVHNNFAKCRLKYLKKAMDKFPDDALFFLFSDDIPWCKNLLSKVKRKIIYIEGNRHYEDFTLITLCKHQIITNSTFSWWAAYLNKNREKRVIAPKRWFVPRREKDNKEIVPDEWEMIDNIRD